MQSPRPNPEPNPSGETWDEEQSRLFIDYGRYFVPQRERQLSTITALLPASSEPFAVLEVACGEGLLAETILEAHAAARLYGLDGSPEMLQAASRRLERFGERFQAVPFDLFSRKWPAVALPVRGVVSSLAIHHLDGPGKAALFREIFTLLAPGGALVIADLVEPAAREGWALAADQWDEAVRERSRALDGSDAGFEEFKNQRWNLYRYFDPQDIDRPSRLVDQLRWLEQAGFTGVDVYWMLAGHAIFGGKKPDQE